MSENKLHKAPHRWPLVLISLDKFAKGIGLIFVYFVLSPRWNHTIGDWVDEAQLNHHNAIVSKTLEAIETTLKWGDQHILFRIGVIVFAGIYLIEGVGLLYEKKWAEWMVVIGTALFLPVEVVEFIRHPRPSMAVVFVVNVVIALYLLWRLHRQAVIKRERAEFEAVQARADALKAGSPKVEALNAESPKAEISKQT